MASRLPHHVLTVLAVTDLGAARQFYRAAFDWPLRVDEPNYVELALPDGRGLGLYQRSSLASIVGRPTTPTAAGCVSSVEIYLHCADLIGTVERLRAAGGRELSALAPRDWGDEAAYFADPDGNIVVAARPLPTQPASPR